MRVSIGPYINYVGPYQLAELLQYVGFSEEYCSRLGDWLDKTWLHGFCEWVHSCKNRRVKIKLHKYDTWSMDSTLALIILPMLKQLQETKQGSPCVDDVDVPEELKSTSAPPLTAGQCNTGYVDDNHHARWDWVLAEMVWSFEQMAEDADDTFFKDAIFDKEGYRVWQARKTRGLTLFGKYFEGLWD
jgi:hypothetical protein